MDRLSDSLGRDGKDWARQNVALLALDECLAGTCSKGKSTDISQVNRFVQRIKALNGSAGIACKRFARATIRRRSITKMTGAARGPISASTHRIWLTALPSARVPS